MKNYSSLIFFFLTVFVLSGTYLAYVLFRPLKEKPVPANFTCMHLGEGKFTDFKPNPKHIFGMGLVYSNHILETASEFTPGEAPPIFLKKKRSLSPNHDEIKLPNAKELMDAILEFEPEIEKEKISNYSELPALLDYEVELGFVLLEDIPKDEIQKENFNPHLGFFIANDVSARSIAVLGEGQKDKAEYWGVSKSFSGFLPVSDKVWIPKSPKGNGIPCIPIQTFVNNEERQSENTSKMIYTPVEMLRFIQKKYPEIALEKNDMIIMGTPGGVAMSSPRWLARFADLLGLNRFQKLKAVLRKDRSKFLKVGDTVIVKGDGFGEVKSKIVE